MAIPPTSKEEQIKMTLYILLTSKKLQNEYEKVSSAENFNVLGVEQYSENALKNIIALNPNLVLTRDLSAEDAGNLLKAFDGYIAMLSSDMNRGNDVAAELATHLPEDYLRFVVIDEANYTPSQVMMQSRVNLTNVMNAQIEQQTNVQEEEQKEDYSEYYDENERIFENIEVGEDTIQINPTTDEEFNKIQQDRNQEILKESIFLKNLKSKIINVTSKKGGVGKTTLVKEIGNMFSKVRLPKKISRENEYMKVLLVDLDLERGNLNAALGVERISPNIFDFIEDIVNKLEKGVPIHQIKYNDIQILSQFIQQIHGNLYGLLRGRTDFPPYLLERILALQISGNLLKDIVDLIIESVRGLFDIIILDTNASFDEITVSSLIKADVNLIVTEPTISSFKNTKSLLDQIEVLDVGVHNLSLIINKYHDRNPLNDSIESITSLFKVPFFDYEKNIAVERRIPLVSKVPFVSQVMYDENRYLFTSDTNKRIKQQILKICEYIYPVFKVRTRLGKNEMRLKKLKVKQKKTKKETSAVVAEEPIEKTDDQIVDEKVSEMVTEMIEKIDGEETLKPITPRELIDYPFNKKTTYEEFIQVMKRVEGLKQNKHGDKILNVKPLKLPRKHFKRYTKETLR